VFAVVDVDEPVLSIEELAVGLPPESRLFLSSAVEGLGRGMGERGLLKM
jgi:hypothetical protein